MATDFSLPNSAPAARPMGLGDIGQSGLVFKRKFRWTMQIGYCFSGSTPKLVAEEFVKVGARPSLEIEEQEINYLHGKFWLPGKATWQAITVTYYDLAGSGPFGTGLTTSGAEITSIFGWIASIYDITDPVNLHMGSAPQTYYGQALLYLYDGCGNTVEGWLLQNMFPTSINFGELDMSSSEECTVELQLRYANVQYKSYCPLQTIDKCPCGPCT